MIERRHRIDLPPRRARAALRVLDARVLVHLSPIAYLLIIGLLK